MDFETFKTIMGWAGAVISGLMLILYNQIKTIGGKVEDTHSKQEVRDLLEMRISPLIESLDRHSDSIKDQTKVLEKLTDTIQLLHRDMAVVKVKVEAMELNPKDGSG